MINIKSKDYIKDDSGIVYPLVAEYDSELFEVKILKNHDIFSVIKKDSGAIEFTGSLNVFFIQYKK